MIYAKVPTPSFNAAGYPNDRFNNEPKNEIQAIAEEFIRMMDERLSLIEQTECILLAKEILVDKRNSMLMGIKEDIALKSIETDAIQTEIRRLNGHN